MLKPIGSAATVTPLEAPEAWDAYVLQFGESLDDVAARFGLTTVEELARLRDMNPLAAQGRAMPGTIVKIPAGDRNGRLSPALQAGPPPAGIATSWMNGYGRPLENQNAYNREIAAAQTAWPALDPLVLKSLLVQESGLQPDPRSNRYGYAGIAQLGVGEAREAGLATGASRMANTARGVKPVFDKARDERFVPARAIPGAAAQLRLKAEALNSGFERYGVPGGDEYWKFVAGAYNGGQGTILSAMRLAYGATVPESPQWSDLLAKPGMPASSSPLYRACAAHFSNPTAKYREISQYAEYVLERARQ